MRASGNVVHQNLDKTFKLNLAVRDITRKEDGTVSFTYYADPYTGHPDVVPDKSWGDGVLFWETFNKCAGTGGNDNVWNGTMTSTDYEPDLNGWNCTGQYMLRINARVSELPRHRPFWIRLRSESTERLNWSSVHLPIRLTANWA